MNRDSFIITAEETDQRLDKLLSLRLCEVGSRTYFQYLIEETRVFVNELPVKKRYMTKLNDCVTVDYIPLPSTEIKPEDIPLKVIYEDDALIIIDKPAGMVVHPSIGHWTGTFVNALLYRCNEFSSANTMQTAKETVRPGIVHRLDKETTGLLIGAKTLAVQQQIIEMFASRQIHKEYVAVCVGNPGKKGTIEEPIGRDPNNRQKMAICTDNGRDAITHFTTLGFDGCLSLVNLVIETGRTHQIRVHMQHRGTPILGDPIYGVPGKNTKYGVHRQLLHAHKLKFTHPVTGKLLEVTADMPVDLEHFAQNLKKHP